MVTIGRSVKTSKVDITAKVLAIELAEHLVDDGVIKYDDNGKYKFGKSTSAYIKELDQYICELAEKTSELEKYMNGVELECSKQADHGLYKIIEDYRNNKQNSQGEQK